MRALKWFTYLQGENKGLIEAVRTNRTDLINSLIDHVGTDNKINIRRERHSSSIFIYYGKTSVKTSPYSVYDKFIRSMSYSFQ